MSFVSTLAKVAIGVAIAKGVGSMVQKGGATSAGNGGLLDGGNSPKLDNSSLPGGLQDMMKDVLAGAPKSAGSNTASGSTSGGLGGLLEDLAGTSGGTTTASASTGSASTGTGGLDDLLGQLTNGGGGGLGDLLGGLTAVLGGAAAGGAAAGSPSPKLTRASTNEPTGETSFGDLLNQSLRNFGEPDVPPAQHQELAAALMVRAMIQAAKADGKVDDGERKKLLDSLKDGTKAELDFVKAELAAPIDVKGLAAQVPKGLEAQIYTMSVLAITLDNKTEAEYLHQLATALGLRLQQVNSIHAQLGVPGLYS